MLQYSKANAKLAGLYDVPELQEWLVSECGRFTAEVYSLDLLSGWSCPFAEKCKSKVYELAGQFTKSGNVKKKLVDGKKTEFRCFSASQEALLPNVYDRRKNNYDLLNECETSEEMTELMQRSLPRNAGIVRQHVGGDFFNEIYFEAWLDLAEQNPSVLFYAYTKSLFFWARNVKRVQSLNNVVLTASRGGSQDWMIEGYGFRESVVVYSEEQADDMELVIDHDDSHAAVPNWSENDFALLIHGVQPAGSEAGKAVSALGGKGSYGKKALAV